MQQTINKIKTSQKTPLTRSRSFSPSMRGMSEGQGEFQTTKKAFTLVELIIVITILAVLATIAFVSFSSYTASSRDTKRIVTIESIEKGLNIFQTQTGKYPIVDNQTSTGIINSDTLSFVGNVGDNVSRLINITPTPKDPVSGNNYVYATSFDQKYFQVAGTQEKPVADKSIFSQTYANSRQAKVLGNYNGLLKKDNKLYNLPSLIYTGSGYLVSNSTYFIVDKGQNIPYKITATDLDNSIATSVILSQLTGTSSVTLTGVTLPTTPGELKININSVVQILGYPGDKIGQETFGTQYFVNNGGSSGGSSTPSVPLVPNPAGWRTYLNDNGCSGWYDTGTGIQNGAFISCSSMGIGNNEVGYPGGTLGITQTMELYFNGNKFTNLDFLTGITDIISSGNYHFANNLLTNVDGLSGFIGGSINGFFLLLNDNQLTNVDGLSSVQTLRELHLQNNQLTNVNGLSNLHTFHTIYLSNNNLTNVNGLNGLVSGRYLYLDNNQLTDISGLSNFTGSGYYPMLHMLNLTGNNISDYRPLSKLVGGGQGIFLDNNPSAIFPGPGTPWCNNSTWTVGRIGDPGMQARAQGFCNGTITQ